MFIHRLARAALGAAVALGATAAPLLAGTAFSGGQVIEIRDECEPSSFNQAGRIVCTGDGNVTRDEALAELMQHQRIGSWKFDPAHRTLRVGETLVFRNRGGELHTFTKVAAFGGGFVASLNLLSGNPIPRPECAQVRPDGSLAPQPPSATNIFVPAGASGSLAAGGSELSPGQNLFLCCLHPWMRAEVTVSSD